MEKNKKIIESTLHEIKMGKIIEESKFLRVANTMRGLVPSIKTIAIMTAENPCAITHSDEYNKDANARLSVDLKNSQYGNGQYGFRKISEQYQGENEKSFLINNISLEDALRLGVKYKQESIVFGERIDEEDGYIGMKFNMYYTGISCDKKDDRPIGYSMGEMNVFVSLEDPDDNYSEYKGRKFVIPFYGITKMITDMEKKKKEITKHYDDVKWDGGKNPPSSISIEDVDEIENLQESAMKFIGSSAYTRRGMLRKKLRSLGLE